MSRIVLAALVAAAAAAGGAAVRADEVYLRNGSSITGRVIEESTAGVLVEYAQP